MAQRIVEPDTAELCANFSGVGGDAAPVPAPAALTKAAVIWCWTSAGAARPEPYPWSSMTSTGTLVAVTNLSTVFTAVVLTKVLAETPNFGPGFPPRKR